MKKSCVTRRDVASGPTVVLTLDAKTEIARGEYVGGKLKSCRLVDPSRQPALTRSRFRDLATTCK